MYDEMDVMPTQRRDPNEKAREAFHSAPVAGGEEIAEIIYIAHGFDPAGKTVNSEGKPYGNWAKAVDAAEHVLSALEAAPPAPKVSAICGLGNKMLNPNQGSMK